jgi:hypothetical protein
MGRFRTDFLFAMPSLVSGAARLVDLGAVYDSYNHSPSPEEADARAMYADWALVGQDLRDAVDVFEAETTSAN